MCNLGKTRADLCKLAHIRAISHKPTQIHTNLRRIGQTREDSLQLVQSCTNLRRFIQISANSLKFVQTHGDAGKLAQTCANSHKLMQVCTNLRKLDRDLGFLDNIRFGIYRKSLYGPKAHTNPCGATRFSWPRSGLKF